MLFLCLAAYKVPDPSGLDPEGVDRQTLYAVALSWLIKQLPADGEIIVVDNTVASAGELHPVLREVLAHPKVIRREFLNQNALGTVNKGAGEHEMCRHALAHCRAEMERHDWVVYYTSRQVMSFPFLLEYLKLHHDSDAIVGNPCYLYPDGKDEPFAPGLYCDMIVAMKSPLFLRFIEAMDPEYLVREKLNSETFLYRFLQKSRETNGTVIREINRWGLLRFNYNANRMEVI